MLKNYLSEKTTSFFGFSPTNGQSLLIKKLSEFTLDHKNNKILLIKGYAGTGKTSLMSSYVKAMRALRQKTILLAPTGRAAKVFGGYANKTAYTIHKKIYRQKSSKDGFGDFVLDKNLHSDTVFIVDEASMISNHSYEKSVFGSGQLLDDLIKYVYNDKSCRLILIGDTAQLPPVGMEISPALEMTSLNSYGLDVIEIELTEVVRQSLESGILFNATEIRKLIVNNGGNSYPKLNTKGFSDIIKLSGEELIEEISSCYDHYSLEETIVINRSNKRANTYNEGIRNKILWRDERISVGDMLMVVKNNYYWVEGDEKIDFIANGDIVEITKISSYQERYGLNFADITIRLVDYDDKELSVKIILDTLSINSAALSSEDNRNLFMSVMEDHETIKPKAKRYKMVRNDAFFNALQVKFSYGVTCHKAQGGQWKAVFIDQGFVTEDMITKEYLRWLYTALTRAKEKVYLVNFKKDFFEKKT